jgi:hypothetical protein
MASSNPTLGVVPVANFPAPGDFSITLMRPAVYVLDFRAQRRGSGRPSAAAVALRRQYKRVIQADPCGLCGGPGGTIDHVEPKVLGGLNSWSNMSGACTVCNRVKDQRGLLEFMLAGRGMSTPSRGRS